MPEKIITPEEEFAYGHIIEALSGGLYPNKFHVIREYIQNSFDAIIKWKTLFGESDDLNIKITIKKPSIFIFDNGTGMDRDGINEYRKVGFSKKKIGEFAGFRGIGKLAGISAAEKLVVTTSPFGVPERYTLEFDAISMLKELEELKKRRECISFNDLIKKFTTLTSAPEKKEEHYTIVELHKIKPDSKILFNEKKLRDYIGRNAPVGFDPKFKYGEEIEEEIKKNVDDYESVKTILDGKEIYKPFIMEAKDPRYIRVFHNEHLVAFCWYCENKEKGQIKPIETSGLIYRYKNFAVGDNFLPRKTLWHSAPHLAFYFMGEIYVCDSKIIPTSQRDDFEHNKARERFYKDAELIAKSLNQIAQKSSDVRRVLHFVNVGKDFISKTSEDFQKKESYLKDMKVEKITQISNVIKNIEKREKNIPEEDTKTRELANQLIEKGKGLLQKFEEADKIKVIDIGEKIKLNEQANNLYEIVLRSLKDFFIDEPEKLEKMIKMIHKNLIDFFSKRKP